MPSNFEVVAKSLREYVIPFVGLKPGKHTFNWKIDDAFFEDLEYSIVHGGNVDVVFILEKKETMLLGNFTLTGKVASTCDKCNAPMQVEIDASYSLVYKFGTEPSDDESLIVLPPETYELDTIKQLYELIVVSIPARKVHDEGKCDAEMLAAMEEYLISPTEDTADEDDNEIDPRWEILKNLN